MGYRVDFGTTIRLTRGDTGSFTFTPYTSDGEVYEVQDGDEIRFSMKKMLSDDYEVLLTKDVDTSDFTVTIDPEDTQDLDFGTYYYDVQLTMADGTVDTYIPDVGNTAKFIIEKEVDVYE